MERDFKTLGIVVKAENVRDNDRLLTILTPDRGLLCVLSFGARKSVRAVKAPLYTEGNFSLSARSEHGQVSLKEVDVISVHDGLGGDLDKIGWASLFSEMVIKGRVADGNIYYLYTQALDALEAEDVERSAIFFLVHYLALSGVSGDYRVCPNCGRAYGETEVLGFSSAMGTAVCRDCDDMASSLILPPNARKYLARVSECTLPEALALGISDDMARRISRNLLRTLRFAFPVPLKTVESGLLV